DLKIFVLKIVDVLHGWIQFHSWQWPRLTGKLELCLFAVISVKVQIAESVDKLTRFQIADLGDHEREEGVGSDIKGHPKKQIGAALVKLATEFLVLHEKLKQRMARRKRHLVKFPRIPS